MGMPWTVTKGKLIATIKTDEGNLVIHSPKTALAGILYSTTWSACARIDVGNFNTLCFRFFCIHDHFESCRLFNRQFAWFYALQILSTEVAAGLTRFR